MNAAVKIDKAGRVIIPKPVRDYERRRLLPPASRLMSGYRIFSGSNSAAPS